MSYKDIPYEPQPKEERKYATQNIDDAYDEGYDFAYKQLCNIIKGMVMLTKDEAHAVAEFIDMNFIDEIRNNDNVDNMYWIRNVIHAYEKLCEYSGYVGLTEPGTGESE